MIPGIYHAIPWFLPASMCSPTTRWCRAMQSYATVYDQSAYNPGGTTTSTAHPGWVYGFAIGSGGALTPAHGSPYQAGVKPTAVVSDPTDRFVYITDFASNQLIGYGIQGGSTLSFLINGPFKTGNEPQAVAIDPRGKYHVRCQRARFFGFGVRDRSFDGYSLGRSEPHRKRHQLNRYAAYRDLR